MSIDFTPNYKQINAQQPFRFWCQKVLPLVYDDSLSYYELLNKVVEYLNVTMENMADTADNVSALFEAYTELQNYVNEYFDSLDIQEEINNKLDAMAADGTLSAILNPIIAQTTSDWLNENVNPVGSAVVVDNSLSISGAAADAKITGEKFSEIEPYKTAMKKYINPLLVDGYWNADGSASFQSAGGVEMRTTIIPVKYSTSLVISVSLSNNHNNWCACLFWDENNQVVSRPVYTINSVNNYKHDFAIPSNACYASLSFRTFADPDIAIEIYTIEKAEATFLKKIELTELDGYVGYNGNIMPADDTRLEKHTPKYSVDNVTELYAGFVQRRSEPANQPWMAISTYDEFGMFIEQNPIPFASTAWAILTELILNDQVKYVVFSYRSYGKYKPQVYFKYNQFISFYTKRDINYVESKPCYDHLFVNYTGNNIVIPHESLYHVRISKALGFNVIEANIAKTSDGVFVVNHLSSGKFGGYFHHVDGTTDISNVELSSVTWQWVVANVRYNSTIPKYRTRPARLEEFLGECKQQGIIPFATCRDDDAISILNDIMGENNYIAYGGDRRKLPTATIYHWVSKTTKAEIIEYCESIGKPFIYGMENPNAFTTEELQDIINTLHTMGYKIGVSYKDSVWYDLEYMGIDYNGTQYRINRIKQGNICNLRTIFNFDNFTYTNAEIVNGELVYNDVGTLVPNITNRTLEVGGIDIEIIFTGSIVIPKIGEHASRTYTSDGEKPVFVTTPIINSNFIPVIEVGSGTIIKDVIFKAMTC